MLLICRQSTSRLGTRNLSRKSEPPTGFFARVVDNIKKEFLQNREINENLDKFRQETKKLEETEALKQVRRKFKEVEKESYNSITSQLERARDIEIVKKTLKMGENISKQGELLKETSAYKKISKELDDIDILYKPPEKLLKRADRSDFQQPIFKPNEKVKSVQLHKDSGWFENWKKFKDENPYVEKLFEFKMKYDESDNPLVRVTKTISEKVGSLFQTTDLSNVLTEICKVDPNFEINDFLVDCEKFIIPTILEALCQNRQDILNDWCHEAVYNILVQPQQEASKLGLKIHSKILHIENIELAMGKIMDQGPVLVVTLSAQQLTYVVDSKGNVVEGDPDKVVQNTYVMAFCRDQADLDPKTAWRLIDVASQQSQFMF